MESVGNSKRSTLSLINIKKNISLILDRSHVTVAPMPLHQQDKVNNADSTFILIILLNSRNVHNGQVGQFGSGALAVQGGKLCKSLNNKLVSW